MKTIKENLVLKNPWYDIFNNDVEFNDGSPGTHLKLVAKNEKGARILPITHDGKIVFVKNFKYALGRALVEVPQGFGDLEDASTADTAKRELLEETNYTALALTFVDTSSSEGNIVTGVCDNYIAWGCRLSKGAAVTDRQEGIESVLLLSPVEALEAAMRGEIESEGSASLVLKLFQSLAPVSAADVEGKSCAFIQGVFCARDHSIGYNPFRNRDDCPHEFLDWMGGWSYSRGINPFPDRADFHKEFADWNRGWAYSKSVI